jgi:hypothetical protein
MQSQIRCNTGRLVHVLYLMMVTEFFSWPNPSSLIMALESTQTLTEISTRNLPGGKGRPAREADNFTAIYEPTV